MIKLDALNPEETLCATKALNFSPLVVPPVPGELL
jgi:hypothetical protein